MSLLIALGVLVALIIAGVLSTGQTWTRRIALAVDVFTASAIWTERSGITISSYCGLALRDPKGNKVLRGLGRVLNAIQTNHCELAIADDRARLAAAEEFLK